MKSRAGLMATRPAPKQVRACTHKAVALYVRSFPKADTLSGDLHVSFVPITEVTRAVLSPGSRELHDPWVFTIVRLTEPAWH